MPYEIVELKARHLAKYESAVDGFDHPVDETVENETGRIVKYPRYLFEYWIDHVHAAIDAGWFKHLTKKEADDFDAQTLRAVFLQVDEAYTEAFKKAFIDPN